MATEEDRQEERDRLGHDPLEAPPAEQLEEENPTDSPNTDSEDGTGDQENDQARASSSLEPPRPVGKSTEGLTIGGSRKQPHDRTAWRAKNKETSWRMALFTLCTATATG